MSSQHRQGASGSVIGRIAELLVEGKTARLTRSDQRHLGVNGEYDKLTGRVRDQALLLIKGQPDAEERFGDRVVACFERLCWVDLVCIPRPGRVTRGLVAAAPLLA